MTELLAVPSPFLECMDCGWIDHEASGYKTCSLCHSTKLLRLSTIDVLATLGSHSLQKNKQPIV